jgi:hypothetical protein
VRHLCLFHHEPGQRRRSILAGARETRRLEEITRTRTPMRVTAAYDGMEIEL